MRLARIIGCGCAALLAACPLPEDQFVLSGQLVDALGRPRPGVEVQLSRNRVASERRCDALDRLTSTQTDDQGRYQFSLVRQQITGGVNARRFFRVEADIGSNKVRQTFWFPDADLELGTLSSVVPQDAWRVTEYLLDGHVASRAESVSSTQWERDSERHTVFSRREWRTVPIDSLGRYDIVPVDWELEASAERQSSSDVTIPAGRGGECPFIDATPCPLTDGRFVPFEFPENTRTIVLNFKREVSISPLTFHEILLEGSWRKAAMLEFPDERAGDGGQCFFEYDYEYLVGWLHTGRLDTAASLTLPLEFGPSTFRSWPRFLDDLRPMGNARRWWLNRLTLPDVPGSAFQLLKYGTVAPVGNLRIAEALPANLGMPRRFPADAVVHHEHAFIEWAAENGAQVGGATGAGGDSPKLLLRKDADEETLEFPGIGLLRTEARLRTWGLL